MGRGGRNPSTALLWLALLAAATLVPLAAADEPPFRIPPGFMNATLLPGDNATGVAYVGAAARLSTGEAESLAGNASTTATASVSLVERVLAAAGSARGQLLAPKCTRLLMRSYVDLRLSIDTQYMLSYHGGMLCLYGFDANETAGVEPSTVVRDRWWCIPCATAVGPVNGHVEIECPVPPWMAQWPDSVVAAYVLGDFSVILYKVEVYQVSGGRISSIIYNFSAPSAVRSDPGNLVVVDRPEVFFGVAVALREPQRYYSEAAVACTEPPPWEAEETSPRLVIPEPSELPLPDWVARVPPVDSPEGIVYYAALLAVYIWLARRIGWAEAAVVLGGVITILGATSGNEYAAAAGLMAVLAGGVAMSVRRR